MKRLLKAFLWVFLILAVLLLALFFWILAADNPEYRVSSTVNAPSGEIVSTYINMKSWPEWQSGIKSTRILNRNTISGDITYEVVRYDAEEIFHDTITITSVNTNRLIDIDFQNMFYHLNKTIELKELTDSTTLVNVHYKYSTDGKLQTFLLSLVKASLKEEAKQELKSLGNYLEKSRNVKGYQ